MTPLLKTLIKYAVIILTCLMMGWMLNGSCNKPEDLSEYERQGFERQIKVLTDKDKITTDSIGVLKVQNEALQEDSKQLVVTVKQLIREKKTNQVLRALLANQNPDSSYWYSNDTLTQTENDSLAVRLAECAKMPEIIQNQVKQLELFDFKVRGLENIIELKDLTIESLMNKVESIEQHPLDTFTWGVIATVVFELIVVTVIILLQ